MDAFLAGKNVTREQLNKRLLADHRNMIAMKIGRDWEKLATFIEVSSQEVHHITEMYPPTVSAAGDRGLAMMRRWEELYGSDATYLKLIQSLEQIGRRDLSEELIKLAINPPEDHRSLLIRQNRITTRGACLPVYLGILCLVTIFLFIGIVYFRYYTSVPRSYSTTYYG